MITIEMPMPEKCEGCPLSHLIISGEYESETMCAAREANGIDISACLVNIMETGRPENCPIIGELDDDRR